MKRLCLGVIVLCAGWGCASAPSRASGSPAVDAYAPGPGKVDEDQPGNPNTRDLRASGEPGARYGTFNDIPQPAAPDETRNILAPNTDDAALPVRVNGLFLEPAPSGGTRLVDEDSEAARDEQESR